MPMIGTFTIGKPFRFADAGRGVIPAQNRTEAGVLHFFINGLRFLSQRPPKRHYMARTVNERVR